MKKRRQNTAGAPRGGDHVTVDGRPAVVVRVVYSADKAGGSHRGQRRWLVQFTDGTTLHVSRERLET